VFLSNLTELFGQETKSINAMSGVQTQQINVNNVIKQNNNQINIQEIVDYIYMYMKKKGLIDSKSIKKELNRIKETPEDSRQGGKDKGDEYNERTVIQKLSDYLSINGNEDKLASLVSNKFNEQGQTKMEENIINILETKKRKIKKFDKKRENKTKTKMKKGDDSEYAFGYPMKNTKRKRKKRNQKEDCKYKDGSGRTDRARRREKNNIKESVLDRMSHSDKQMHYENDRIRRNEQSQVMRMYEIKKREIRNNREVLNKAIRSNVSVNELLYLIKELDSDSSHFFDDLEDGLKKRNDRDLFKKILAKIAYSSSKKYEMSIMFDQNNGKLDAMPMEHS